MMRLGLLVTVFLSGAALMSLEMASFRLVEPELGGDLIVWGSLISVFLGGMAIGALVGGRWADSQPSLARLGLILAAGGAVALAIPLYADAVLTWAYPGAGAPLPSEWGTGGAGGTELAVYHPPDMRWPALLAGTLLFGLPAILLGMVSPYAARLFVREMPQMGTHLGQVYGVSTVGSILGTLGTAFYLISLMGTRSLLSMNGAVLVGLGLALIIANRLRRREPAASA
ncbi:MAG: fused MFS/spermidine synthase [Planctomycetota bacterium]|nr:fused MFS/spermidine synthase [Planctomycetota bacterium]